ncbi:MAG: PH domain-containing protein [Verrucomicrobiota bacterium]
MQGSKRIPDIREALLYKAEQCETDCIHSVIEYKSRLGLELVITFTLFALGMIGGGVYLITLGAVTLGSLLIGILLLLAGAAFVLGYPITYTFTEEQFMIRCGAFYRKSIPLGIIKGAYPCFTVDAAPAWSCRKLKITFSIYMNLASVSISPRNEDAFLEDLIRKCPQLNRQDNKAIPHTAWEQ